MRTYLFSYGTLLPGFAPQRISPLVCRLRRVGTGCVRGRLYDLGRYPGAVLGSSSSRVVGEVFELPGNATEILQVLDNYEGYNPSRPKSSEFVRVSSDVILSSKRLPCWVYAYNRPLRNAILIPDGDFVGWRNSQRKARI